MAEIETITETDNRIIKASYKDCPLDDRRSFGNSKCIIPISVGQNVHEGDKFRAYLQLINRTFKECTVLVDDIIQRHTLRINKTDFNDEQAYKLASKLGAQWLDRNRVNLKLLSIPHKIIRWDHWLFHKDFNKSLQQISSLYKNSTEYKNSIHANIHDFLDRFEKNNPNISFDTKRAFQLCLDYLLEECACMNLWTYDNYDFEVYPTGRNKAMAATHKLVIQPKNPKLLRSVSLRFKKYSAKMS